jgi:hypothetical protein
MYYIFQNLLNKYRFAHVQAPQIANNFQSNIGNQVLYLFGGWQKNNII